MPVSGGKLKLLLQICLFEAWESHGTALWRVLAEHKALLTTWSGRRPCGDPFRRLQSSSVNDVIQLGTNQELADTFHNVTPAPDKFPTQMEELDRVTGNRISPSGEMLTTLLISIHLPEQSYCRELCKHMRNANDPQKIALGGIWVIQTHPHGSQQGFTQVGNPFLPFSV